MARRTGNLSRFWGAVQAAGAALGALWLAWTSWLLATSRGREVDESVRRAVDIARSVRSWPLAIILLLVLAIACVRLYRARRWLELGIIAALAISLQLRAVLDYSDRTLVIIVMAEVAAFTAIGAVRVTRSSRQFPPREGDGR